MSGTPLHVATVVEIALLGGLGTYVASHISGDSFLSIMYQCNFALFATCFVAILMMKSGDYR